MKKLLISTYSLAVLTPMLALAQFGEIDDFLGDISDFINNILIPLLFAIALFFFLWGVFKFLIQGKDDSADREEGRRYMIWAIIGFVVMVSVFGIVNLIANGLGFSDDEELDNIPNVPTSNR
tara:strand:- start:1315 stop:1680 length:366 start_codon:yes stop_codon:yes gene_type:complete